MPVTAGGGSPGRRPDGTKPPKGTGVTNPSETQPLDFPQPEPVRIPSNQFAERMADKALFSAEKTKAIWANTPVSQTTATQIPDALFQAIVVGTDPVITAALNDYTIWQATLNGNEAMGAMMGTNFITDPDSAEATRRLIADMAQLPFPAYQPGMSVVAQNRPDEELVDLITSGNIEAIAALPATDRMRTKTLATELLSTLQELPDTGDAGEMKRAVATAVSGDLTLSLTSDEIRAITQGIPALERNAGFGGTTQEIEEEAPPVIAPGASFFARGAIAAGTPVAPTPETVAPGLEALGFEQYRNVGQGIIVLDPEDAANNLARAYAIKLLIQQEFPDKQVVYGRQGAWGSFIDHISQPVDYVTAPLGAGLRQLSELGERPGRSEQDKEAAKAASDAISEAVQNKDLDAYLEIRKGLRPMYDLPGGVDPSDDVTWVEEAHRAMAMFDDFATDDVGKQEFYDQMGENTRPQVIGFGFADSFTRAADLMPGDSGFNAMYAVSGLVGALMLDPLNWGPALLGGIKAARLIPKFERAMESPDVLAALLQIERPLLTDAAALSAARRLTGATRMERRLLPGQWREVATAGTIGSPVEIGRGLVKNLAYQTLAQTPEAFAASAPVRATVKALWKVRQELGSEDAIAVFSHFFSDSKGLGGDTRVARYLGQAESLEEMELFTMGAMTGMHAELPNVAKVQARISELTARLNPLPAPPVAAVPTVEAGATLRAGVEDMVARLREAVPGLEDELARLGYEKRPGALARAREELKNTEAWLAEHPVGEAAPPPPVMPELVSEADHADAVAEIGRLQDMVEGRDFIRPLKLDFSTRDYQRLARMTHEAADRIRPVQYAAAEVAEKIDPNVLAEMGQRLDDALRVDPTIQTSSLKFWRRFRNSFKDSGAGHRMIFPGTSAKARYLAQETLGTVDEVARDLRQANPELGVAQSRMAARAQIAAAGPMADEVERSYTAMSHLMRRFGLSDDRITELMKPWATGALDDDPIASFNWFTDSWEQMVEESPRLNSLGKEHFGRMWDSTIEDRVAGKIRIEHPDGRVTYEPTLQEFKTNALGDPEPHPFPVISADMLKNYTLPSEHDMVEWFSVVQRTMREWRKASVLSGKRPISLLHGGMTAVWHGWNQLWKTWVLIPRLGGAIPLRIGIEQQVRGPAAAEAASMVWHPSEWFKSTTWGKKIFPDTDFNLVGKSPTHALGTTIDAYDINVNRRLLHMGRGTVHIGEEGDSQVAFFRGYSDRLRRWSASPEVREWHLPHLGSPETTITTMEGSPMGRHFLGLYADRGYDAVEAVTRTQTELAQLIGTGEGAELIRVALRQGRVRIGGKVVTVGTEEFADAIQQMYRDGTWKPITGEIPVSEGVYLPAERLDAAREIRDTIFYYGYAVPDVAAARSPYWAQISAREYRNLVRLGYAPDRALQLAHASAARRVADVMFEIGAHSPGDYFLRNMNPFFPAFRELGETWGLRVPLRIGEGNWPLGAAALTRRADIWMDFFKQTGLVKEDAEGRNIVPMGFLAPIIRVFGGEAMRGEEFEVSSFLESLAGLFPLPTNLQGRDEQGKLLPLEERLQGLIPTLGQPAATVLGALNDLADGKLDELTKWLTLTGTDTSLGPRQVDQLFEAFRYIPPWVFGSTRAAHQNAINSSIMDGMRIAMNEPGGDPPQLEDFDSNDDGDLSPDEQAEFWKTSRSWTERILDKGQQYSTSAYLAKSLFGMLLPVSVQFQDADKAKFDKMWAFIDTLPEELKSPYISAFMDAYPEFDTYMNGKTLDKRTVDHPNETMEGFFQAVKDGAVEFRTPEDYAIFSLGMRSYSIYQSRVNTLYDNAGDTPAEQIMNFDAKAQIDAERQEWEDFLALTSITDNWMPNQTQSFEDMFNAVQGYRTLRDEGRGRLRPSLEQEQVVDFDRAMKEYAKYFSYNHDTSDDYFALKDAAYAAMGGEPGSDLAQANQWYFDTVTDGFRDKMNVLWDSLDGLDDDEKAPVYQQIRDLSNEYDHMFVNKKHPEWGEFASPEAYSYAQLTKQEQEAEITHWADLPATFLTSFQRQQVGYNIEDQEKANLLANYVTRNEIKFKKQTERYDLYPGSAAYEANRVIFDKAYTKKAEDLGLADYWKQANAPAYTRIGAALNLNDRTATWGLVVDAVRRATTSIENTKSPSTGQYYSAKGDSDVASRERRALATQIEQWKKNDPAFRTIMDNLAVSLGGDDGPMGPQDLVDSLFFDVFQF